MLGHCATFSEEEETAPGVLAALSMAWMKAGLRCCRPCRIAWKTSCASVRSLHGEAHPNIWVAFAAASQPGWSEHRMLTRRRSLLRAHMIIFAMCHVDAFEVRVRFSAVKLKPDWHPSHTNRFR